MFLIIMLLIKIMVYDVTCLLMCHTTFAPTYSTTAFECYGTPSFEGTKFFTNLCATTCRTDAFESLISQVPQRFSFCIPMESLPIESF